MNTGSLLTRRRAACSMALRGLTPLLLLPFTAAAGAAQQRADSTLLPPITVTATRVDSANMSAVVSSTVLHGNFLRARGITNVGDALRLVPGVSVIQTSARGSETGMFMRGGERDFVLVLVDGVPLNEPGGFLNLAHLTMDNVERVEVVRGPTSVLYGSDAVSGVVQIFTKRGGAGIVADLSGAVGSRDLREGGMSVAGGGSVVSYSAGAARHRSGGIYDLNNRNRSDSYSGVAGLRLSPSTQLEVAARLTDGQYNYPTTFYGAPADSNSYSGERRLSTGATLSSAVSSAIRVSGEAAYTFQKVILADPSDEGTPFPFDSRIRTERVSGGGRVEYRGIPRSIITVGAEYESQNSATEGGESVADNPLLQRWTRSGYGQVLASPGGGLEIVAGARLDENQRFGSFATWRAAAGVQLGENMRLRGAIGTGFREPQFLEISGGGFARPNTLLQPETSRSTELSVERSIVPTSLFVSATWFGQVFDDLIQYASISGDPDYVNQYQNAGRGSANGWELEVRGNIFSTVDWTTSFTILDAKIEGSGGAADVPLPRRPSRYGNGSISWNPRNGMVVGADLSYVGRRPDTRFFADFSSAQEVLGGYGKLDLSASYLVPGLDRLALPLTLTLRADNALDRRYEAVAGFSAPRRTVSIGASVRYSPVR